MKYFDWNEGKNDKLKNERCVSFEECLVVLSEGKILDIIHY